MKKLKIYSVKSDIGVSKSSVAVGTNKSLIEHELMLLKPQFKASKYARTIQLENQMFKSNFNIIDLNAGKNLGFKLDSSFSYAPFDKYHFGMNMNAGV
jgi:hypothetical protein